MKLVFVSAGLIGLATSLPAAAMAGPLDKPALTCAAPGSAGKRVSYAESERAVPALPPCAAFLSTVTVPKEKPAFRT